MRQTSARTRTKQSPTMRASEPKKTQGTTYITAPITRTRNNAANVINRQYARDTLYRHAVDTIMRRARPQADGCRGRGRGLRRTSATGVDTINVTKYIVTVTRGLDDENGPRLFPKHDAGLVMMKLWMNTIMMRYLMMGTACAAADEKLRSDAGEHVSETHGTDMLRNAAVAKVVERLCCGCCVDQRRGDIATEVNDTMREAAIIRKCVDTMGPGEAILNATDSISGISGSTGASLQ